MTTTQQHRRVRVAVRPISAREATRSSESCATTGRGRTTATSRWTTFSAWRRTYVDHHRDPGSGPFLYRTRWYITPMLRSFTEDSEVIHDALNTLDTFITFYNAATPFLEAMRTNRISKDTSALFRVSDVLTPTVITSSLMPATTDIAIPNYDDDPTEASVTDLKAKKLILINTQKQFLALIKKSPLLTNIINAEADATGSTHWFGDTDTSGNVIEPFHIAQGGGAKKTRKPRLASTPKPKPKSVSKKTATKK